MNIEQISKAPIILFDGVCNLCNAWVRFLIKRDHNATYQFAALQGETAKLILGDSLSEREKISSIVLFRQAELFRESDAVIEILKGLGGVWRLVFVFKLLPKFMRDWCYRLVANNRYRLFGKRESCAIPSESERSRFLS